MKKNLHIVIPLVIIVFGLLVFLNAKDDGFRESSDVVNTPVVLESNPQVELKNQEVERYGVLRRSSTSGDMRFDYYDIQQKKVLDNFEGHPWFFALKDESMTDEYLQYLQENKGAVFKIVGKRLADDCDYYEDGSCLENIAIEKIEVAK